MRFAALVLAAATTLGLSSTAAAQEGGAKTNVTLRDGAAYWGELIERVPNDHVTIKLATGEVKRFAWAEIAEPLADRAGEAPRRAEPTADAPPPGVRVTIVSDDLHAGLFRIAGYGTAVQWMPTPHGAIGGNVQVEEAVQECGTPCGRIVDPQFSYRIAGVGVTPSGPFQLPRDREHIRLNVSTGSSAARTGGKVLTWVGVPLTVFGSAFFAIGAAADSHMSDGSDGGKRSVMTIGAIMGGVGLVSLVSGIVLWATSGTSVEADTGIKLSKLAPQGFVF